MVAVDICNLALAYLGDTATVASIDPPEGSAQAQHCARFYSIALNLMLGMQDWNFITKRVALAVLADAPVPDWQFAYAIPSDVSHVISVLPKCLYPTDSFSLAVYNLFGYQPYEWERNCLPDFQIEVVNGQQAILSNTCDAVARYTCTTVQPGMFPALFTDALAWKLASMLAGPILKGDAGAAESKRCLQMHTLIAEQAKGQDANQRHGNLRPQPSWIVARGGYAEY